MNTPPNRSLLVESWLQTADDLGIRIVAPFELVLESGARVQAKVLVRDFGDRHGMLVVSDFEIIKRNHDEIIRAGYGYSTMSEPRIEAEYDRDTSIEVLADWGWTGPEYKRPTWLEAEAPDSE